MNKSKTATEHRRNRLLVIGTSVALLLVATFPHATRCDADETAKASVLRKAAQQWMQVGTEQYERSLYSAAGRSFRRAAVYRKYLAVAEQEELDELTEAALAKEMTSTSVPATKTLAREDLQSKVKTLTDRTPPTTAPVTAETIAAGSAPADLPVRANLHADSVTDGRFLTQKERAFVADASLTAPPPLREQRKIRIRPAHSLSASTAPEVVFNPGDVIEIRFFYTPALNVTQTVRPDGMISLELVHEVRVAGKTAAELQSELLELYRPHLRDPEIAVIARTLYTHRVFVGGQVMKPGVVQMPGEMTALEAIMEVGGFDLRAAERKNVIVIRYTGGQRYVYKLDLKRAVAGNEAEPFYLQPRDIIHVPRTGIAKLNQWIDQHINKIIPDTGFFFRQTSGNTAVGVGSYR